MEWTVPENKGTGILMKIKNNDVWEVPPWGGGDLNFFRGIWTFTILLYSKGFSTIHIKPAGHTQTSVHIQSP